MWTPTTRKQHIRETSRYQTDVTDEEWLVIMPHLPSANSTGRPRAWPMREIINGIFYVMRSGCPWRLLPSDLPPWSTIYRWFAKFRDEDRFAKINHALVMFDRERTGRQSSPTGCNHRFPEREDDRSWRTTRLRCRQEDQRTQAPCTRRYGWAWPRTRAAPSKRPRSRWRRTAPAHLAPHLPIHPTRFR